MSNDFSLIGYESVPVSEYLPILENIKDDLKFIYDKCLPTSTTFGTMGFDSDANHENNSSASTETDSKRTLTSNVSVNTSYSIDGKSLVPETQHVANRLHEILSIPSDLINEDTPRDIPSLLSVLESYVKRANFDDNSDVDYESVKTMNEELIQLKQVIKQKEIEINKVSDTLEQNKEELMTKDGKIEQMKTQLQNNLEELSIKEKKIESVNKTIRSQTEELTKKDGVIHNLEEELKKLQKEQISLKEEHHTRKPSVEMKNILDEKIKQIVELELEVEELKSKSADANEQQERISELEDKLKHLETQYDENLDANYQQLLCNLRVKRTELRDRDAKIQELENEISESDNKIRRLERELRKTNTTLTENLHELAESEKYKEEVEAKFKTLLREHKELKKSALNEEAVSKYKGDIENLKNALRKKDFDLRAIEQIVCNLKQEKETLQDNCTSLGIQNTELEKYRKEIADKNKELEELKAELEKRQTAILNMRQKIKVRAEDQVDPQELRRLQNQVKTKDMELEQLHAKVENLNEAFDKKADECELANKKLKEVKAEVDTLKQLQYAGNKYNEPKGPPRITKPETNPFPEWWKKHMS